MTILSVILLWTGVILLVLGIFSGFTLFFKAAFGGTTKDITKSTGTLWGLFLVCILAGIILGATAAGLAGR